MKFMNITDKKLFDPIPEEIIIKLVDNTGKERIRTLQDLKIIDNKDGTFSLEGSYVPTYEELFESNLRLTKIINQAIEYIEWNLDKNEEIIEYINFDGNFKKVLDILPNRKK